MLSFLLYITLIFFVSTTKTQTTATTTTTTSHVNLSIETNQSICLHIYLSLYIERYYILTYIKTSEQGLSRFLSVNSNRSILWRQKRKIINSCSIIDVQNLSHHSSRYTFHHCYPIDRREIAQKRRKEKKKKTRSKYLY